MYSSRLGPQHLVMEGFLVGEDAKPWKGRDVVLWGTEVRILCGDLFCVLIGHLVFQIATLYSELALLTIVQSLSFLDIVF